MAIPSWLTQNNGISSTKQIKAPYIAAARVPMPINFQLCHRKAERVRTRLSLKFDFNIGAFFPSTTKLSYKTKSCSF